jgi:Holliday junction resolvase RusA-like endonuclease
MIETSTPLKNELDINQIQFMTDDLISQENENEYYNSIKPNLDRLIKKPSDKVIEQILAFSKSI